MKTLLTDNSPECCTPSFILRKKVIPPMIVADGSSNESTNPKTLHEKQNAQSHKIYHIQKAKYYDGFWRRCMTNSPTLSDPQSCGWLIENHVLDVTWMSGLPTPEAFLKLTACKFRKSVPYRLVSAWYINWNAQQLLRFRVVETRYRRLMNITGMKSTKSTSIDSLCLSVSIKSKKQVLLRIYIAIVIITKTYKSENSFFVT